MTRVLVSSLLLLALGACSGQGSEPKESRNIGAGCDFAVRFVASAGDTTNVCPKQQVEAFVRDYFERGDIVGPLTSVSCQHDLAADLDAKVSCRVVGDDARTAVRVAVSAISKDSMELELGPIGIISGSRAGY